MERLPDIDGRELRLTQERLEHIERRPEMEDQRSKIEETLVEPDDIRESNQDDTVHLYYKHYPTTPVTEKYLLVVVKFDVESPFIITAFFTDRIKSGTPIDIDPEDADTPE